jgi:hypothetical protein
LGSRYAYLALIERLWANRSIMHEELDPEPENCCLEQIFAIFLGTQVGKMNFLDGRQYYQLIQVQVDEVYLHVPIFSPLYLSVFELDSFSYQPLLFFRSQCCKSMDNKLS